MEALVSVLKRHPGPTVLVCALFFRAVHRLLRTLPVPKVVRQDDTRCWKWRNLSLSLFHSVLSGTWALTCAAVWPETLTNVHKFYTPLSYLLICVSTGYFVQDASDIILTGHARASWEFLLHHAMVIWCFLYTLYTKQCVSGAVVALFVEVNSVTLHLRLLLKLANAQSSSMYHINKHINIFTYVTFRLGAQFYLTWYNIYNYSKVDHAGCFLTTMIMINIMMLIYFYRLLRTDFFPHKPTQNGVRNKNKFIND